MSIRVTVGASVGAVVAIAALCIGVFICRHACAKKKRQRPATIPSPSPTPLTGATVCVPASTLRQHPPGLFNQQAAIVNPAFSPELDHSRQEGITLSYPPDYTPFPSEYNLSATGAYTPPEGQQQPQQKLNHLPPPVYTEAGDLACGGHVTLTETPKKPVVMPSAVVKTIA